VLLCVLPLLDAIDVNFVLRLKDGVIRPIWPGRCGIADAPLSRGARHDDGTAHVRMKPAQERIPSRLVKAVDPGVLRVKSA
jgi:hypothetical protein